MELKLYNTWSRKKETFKPIKKGHVSLYTCGPTVYNFAHIGNLRSYLFEDILKRILLYDGFKVKHVMNILMSIKTSLRTNLRLLQKLII